MSVRRKVASRLPGVREVLDDRDRARAQRDAWRAKAVRRRDEVEELRREVRALTAEVAAERARQLKPSFGAAYRRLRRTRQIALDELGRQHPIWQHNGKLEGRDLARRAGVDLPELLAGPLAPERLPLDPHRPSVVKPREGYSSRGVMPLLPTSSGGWWSVFDRREVTTQEVRAMARAAVTAAHGVDEVLVEELIPAPRPDRHLPEDWKCYCIAGRVELVMQKDNGDGNDREAYRFRWWDRDGDDLGAVRPDRYDPDLPPAEDHAAIVAAAERVAALVAGPFVRVDLYTSHDRVVFGEITPHPGGDQRFRADVDRRLGIAMERAEAAAASTTWAHGDVVVG